MKQQNERHTQEQRHMMQLIRRRMTQKVKPSGKAYNRKNKSYDKKNDLGLVLENLKEGYDMKKVVHNLVNEI